MVATVAALIMAGSAVAVVASTERKYPLFMQCDEKWASDEMGVAGNGERVSLKAENLVFDGGCSLCCAVHLLGLKAAEQLWRISFLRDSRLLLGESTRQHSVRTFHPPSRL
jgi:hypothetical protein